ncbi:tetratricopeptide repeat protein [bacterium]|nr:tetratricopeptide repeat protein [bacterium]
MRIITILCSFLLFSTLFALNKSDVIKMSKIGLGSDVILSTVKSSTDVIPMEKEDIIEMKKEGVPEAVIKELVVRYLESKKQKEDNQDNANATAGKTEEELKKEAEERKKKEEEEQRIREEEQKKAEQRIEDRKKAQLQREKNEKLLPLQNGIAFYKKGDYETAIKKIDSFFSSDFPKDTVEYYTALFTSGMIFYEAGAYYTALEYFKEVLLRGVEITPDGEEQKGLYFMLAFEKFTDITTSWPFSSDFDEIYGIMSTYNTAMLPAEFQEKFNYFMGKYYTKWASNPTYAEMYFSKIVETSEFYASAQYLWGLIDVKSKKYQASIGHFQNAIVASEKSTPKQSDLMDLSYLALGRIYYELAAVYMGGGEKDRENAMKLAKASLETYKKVSKDSPKLVSAYYESSWSAFISGDYDISLGYLHALHSSYLRDYYYPDKYILEAGIYLNMCLFKYADEAVNSFKKRYEPLKQELDDFLSEPITPEEYFKILDKIASGTPFKGKKFSNELVSYIISDTYFYENYKALKKLIKEVDILEKWSKSGKGSVVILNKYFEDVSKKKEKLYTSTGAWIRRKLQNASNELMNLNLKSDEISFEIISAEKIALQQQKEAITKGDQSQSKEDKVETESSYILKSDEMMWKFNGEYWIDEIDNYRSFLQGKCPK